jgi:cytochrome b pre-mRNA-processing protein 3
MIFRLFRQNPGAGTIRDLYGAIVAQARLAAFYRAYGVPDTVEGRFDLIVLHLVIVLARLEADTSVGRSIGQKLFDEFCRDMDGNLREMGVGDLAVPKKMRQFAGAFYGRQAAYLAALAAPGERELANALARNIFIFADMDRVHGRVDGPARLARYVRTVMRQFEVQDKQAFESALLRGEIAFPNPETIVEPVAETSQNVRTKTA